MNVEELLKDRGIFYRNAGKDYQVKCLNPEHDDQNPSMRIDKVLGIFNCLSCGFKGNLFRLFGAEPEYVDMEVAKLQDKIQNMLSEVYLEKPVDAIPFTENYRNISGSTYKKYEAFRTSLITGMEDRLVFPIRNMSGHIKGFCGRAMHGNEKAKYLFYPTNVKLPLFPAWPTIYKDSIFIVEGIFDALNMIDKGISNVVCAWGTGSLHNAYRDKLSHFKIMGANKMYILFDGDKAGIENGAKLTGILNKAGYNAEQIELPEGVDPGGMSQIDLLTLKNGIYNENSSS